MTMQSLPHIYIASYNTKAATELAIRSLYRFAGHPFLLTVGDSASKDGSIEMLRRLESAGRLQLLTSASPRSHAEWLDIFIRDCEQEYAMFLDSDIELVQPNCVSDAMEFAKMSGAAIVGAESEPAGRTVTNDGRSVWSPGRKASIWFTLVDVPRVRGLGLSYTPWIDFSSTVDDVPVHYDVGARIEAAVLASGYSIDILPAPFKSRYIHFRGLSWRREPGIRLLRYYARRVRLELRLLRRRWDRIPKYT